MPSIELVRFVSSGTEAAMSAIRLARGFTRRDRILKFAGGYHGHADALLASAGSGLATLGIPSSPGVPRGDAADTIVAPYNDVDAAADAVARYGEGLAAILVEPVAGNMGVVPPRPGFLEALRALCDASGALLVFDEVITGFRVARGGAQERYGVTPDLTILGKIVGGGLPLGRLRRPRRRDGAARPVGRRLPGGHAVREPARDRGRPLGPAPTPRPGRLRRARAPGRAPRDGTRPRSAPSSGWGDAHALRQATSPLRTSTTLRAPTPSATARCSVTCSRAGSTSRPRSSRRCSCRSHTATPRSTAPWRPLRTSRRTDLWEAIALEASPRARSGATLCFPSRTVSPWRCSRRCAGAARARARDRLRGVPPHYGRPRLFAPADADTALLLGDYLYAHGLVRIAASGEVEAVRELAELISLCAHLRAEGGGGDGEAWAATAIRLGEDAAPPEAVERALAEHRRRMRR